MQKFAGGGGEGKRAKLRKQCRSIQFQNVALKIFLLSPDWIVFFLPIENVSLKANNLKKLLQSQLGYF